jgi:hypothetical protein
MPGPNVYNPNLEITKSKSARTILSKSKSKRDTFKVTNDFPGP